ncbi:hypothetical protein JD292_08110 [Leucobacter sp. CSA2]|uniref:Biotin carboxyl carrier protein of acetyl-CoA carboxylase n=1 Tax=Leucobacter edaphi TaxID=2796472 RepID=A0A934QCB1_9MICO|nr:biotin/lipoyl-containing protein [Leucobacter edaphi]MBK0422036.1 hypothetical protein [Leucobacter edaphi]
MTNHTPDITELKAIVDWVNVAEDVRELSLRVGDVELHISRNGQSSGSPFAPAAGGALAAAPTPSPAAEPAQAAAAVAPAAAHTERPAAAAAPVVASAAAQAAPTPDRDSAEPAADETVVAAPMVGTFYASPQPGAPTFVSVGDRVQPDTVLGIVEVMKLMNNVEAGVSGTVVRVLAENESLVEFGQPLIVIKRDAS